MAFPIPNLRSPTAPRATNNDVDMAKAWIAERKADLVVAATLEAEPAHEYIRGGLQQWSSGFDSLALILDKLKAARARIAQLEAAAHTGLGADSGAQPPPGAPGQVYVSLPAVLGAVLLGAAAGGAAGYFGHDPLKSKIKSLSAKEGTEEEDSDDSEEDADEDADEDSEEAEA